MDELVEGTPKLDRNSELSAEYVADPQRERRRLFKQVVLLQGYGDNAQTEEFNPPDEGQLVHVEWDREVAVLTWMVTRYPEGKLDKFDPAQSDGDESG